MRKRYDPIVLPEILRSPAAIAADDGITVEERRSLLAAWASDAQACENAPHLRRSSDGVIASIDEILSALASLAPAAPLGKRAGPPVTSRRRIEWPRRSHRWTPKPYRRSRPDDDDTPPPAAPALMTGACLPA